MASDRERISERLREGMGREMNSAWTRDPYVALAPEVEAMLRDAAERAWAGGWKACWEGNAKPMPADFKLVVDREVTE